MSRRNPTEPYQIGHSSDGQPIWVDPKDLILTGDDQAELGHNISRDKRTKAAQQMAEQVLHNSRAFFEQTAFEMFGNCPAEDPAAAVAWADDKGLSMIQDGFTTIVKVRGKIVRSMTATVDPRFYNEALKWVRKLLKAI